MSYNTGDIIINKTGKLSSFCFSHKQRYCHDEKLFSRSVISTYIRFKTCIFSLMWFYNFKIYFTNSLSLFSWQCGGKNIRFCVMNNLLPSGIKLHEKYDLKGSTYRRKASKEERAKKCPTLKDLDFTDNHQKGLKLEAETYNALLKTISRDVRVLASFKIMDYSLLVGIHNLDAAREEREAERAKQGKEILEDATCLSESQHTLHNQSSIDGLLI